jgi:hypothetical protein
VTTTAVIATMLATRSGRGPHRAARRADAVAVEALTAVIGRKASPVATGHCHAPRRAADEGSGTEQHEACQERPPATPAVGEPGAQQQRTVTIRRGRKCRT